MAKWFERDRGVFSGKILKPGERLAVSIEKLGDLLNLFCEKKLFYYGVLPKDKSSFHIQTLAEKNRFKTKSKPVHFVKSYLDKNQLDDLPNSEQKGLLPEDENGVFVRLPKCNFDVEITMDILRFAEEYDTLVLMSSDRDFIPLLSYMRQKGKKIILIHSGPTAKKLKDTAHLNINAQRIKELICFIK